MFAVNFSLRGFEKKLVSVIGVLPNGLNRALREHHGFGDAHESDFD